MAYSAISAYILHIIRVGAVSPRNSNPQTQDSNRYYESCAHMKVVRFILLHSRYSSINKTERSTFYTVNVGELTTAL